MKKKLLFNSKSRLADIIHADYRLIPIIGRFGIEFGFGNKTIEEVCIEKEINVWFALEIINSFHDSNYFPKKSLQNFPAKLIIEYLSNTHDYYLKVKIPEIQEYIDKMERAVKPENYKNITLLNGFFNEYKEELRLHLENEDQYVFPYILSIENALNQKIIDDQLYQKILINSIENYERNHEDAEVKLNDLKNLIIKFMPPVLCKELCQNLLIEIFRLESDLGIHTNIEDKVLIPKVKLLEKNLLEIRENKL